MNELPINRARNPLRNQGYMMRLTGESRGAFMGSLAEELVSEQSMENDDAQEDAVEDRKEELRSTRRRIKSSRDAGELVLNPIQLIRS